MTEKRKYDSTVARIAGNIAAGLVGHFDRVSLDRNSTHDWIVLRSVSLARATVARIEQTEIPNENAKSPALDIEPPSPAEKAPTR